MFYLIETGFIEKSTIGFFSILLQMQAIIYIFFIF